MSNKVVIWSSSHFEYNPVTRQLANNESSYYEEDEVAEENPKIIQNMSATPWGFWRIDDAMHPMRQFKMWMGHTNFNLNRERSNIIKKVPGVEVLSILTRYRFIIGVGEAFNTTEVKLAIEEALGVRINKIINNPEILGRVNKIKEKLKKEKKWAIFIFPNGNIEYTIMQPNNPQQFVRQLDLYKAVEEKSGGILIEPEYDNNF